MPRAALLVLGSWFLLALACKQQPPAPAPPPPAPVQPAPKTPVAPAASDAAPPPAAAAIEDAPLTPCQRKCSISANHKQLQGFLRCEKAGRDVAACKDQVLSDTDTARAACRKRCPPARQPL